MSSSPPFVDPDSGALDLDQIRAEALPLAGLVTLFTGLALVPFVVVIGIGVDSGLGIFFTLVTGFVLAVGTGVVLLYVVARGIALADE